MKTVVRRQRTKRAAKKKKGPSQRPDAGPPFAVPPPGYPYPPGYYYPCPYPYRYAYPPRLVSMATPPHPASETKLVSSEKDAPDMKASMGADEGTLIPHENDVLMGRGGKNNAHVGNEKLRGMARAMREVYIKSRKKTKTKMAFQLVQQVYALNPPGRFLQRDPVTMIWEEVDLDTARHKTSQCLRDAAAEKSSYTKTKPTEMPPLTGAADGSGEERRASTPVHSNLAAHKIDPSPASRPSVDGTPDTRNRIGSWESGSLTRTLIECWEGNDGSFLKPRRGSMTESTGSHHARNRMYTWESNQGDPQNLADMDVEDAVLIPPEEMEGDESFSLLDVSQIDEIMEMQMWQPDMYDQSESPFDTEFFY